MFLRSGDRFLDLGQSIISFQEFLGISSRRPVQELIFLIEEAFQALPRAGDPLINDILSVPGKLILDLEWVEPIDKSETAQSVLFPKKAADHDDDCKRQGNGSDLGSIP